MNSRVRAVLFDVDGTLYRQPPVRATMAWELARLPLSRSLSSSRETWRTISAFRRVQEELRALGSQPESLNELQYAETGRRVGRQPAAVRSEIEEWMFRRPLRHLRRWRDPHVADFLSLLATTGTRAGVFSDYPVASKLEALGLTDAFSPALCATDPEINALKPHPRGLLRACDIWGLPPDQVLYIGDRADVDAQGPAEIGMRCAILVRSGRARTRSSATSYAGVPSFEVLPREFEFGR